MEVLLQWMRDDERLRAVYDGVNQDLLLLR